MVDREGRVTRLAAFNAITWHAGQSSYKGRRGVNGFSIGIEMVGPGEMVRMTIALCKALVEAYRLKDITTHWAVSPKRKVDPNPLFPIELCRKVALGEAAGPMGLT